MKKFLALFLIIGLFLAGFSGCDTNGQIADEQTAAEEEEQADEAEPVDEAESTDEAESISDVNKLTIEQFTKLMAGDMTVEEIDAMLEEKEFSHLDMDVIAAGYREIGEYDKAEQILKEAIAIDETFGDHYGNLISIYVEQEKFDESLETFNAAMDKVILGREFVYFHQTRAFLFQEDGESAAATCTKGIEEMELLSEVVEPYENLYLACINTYRALLSEKAKQNLPEEELLEMANQLIEILSSAAELFPDSEEIQDVYNYYMEE